MKNITQNINTYLPEFIFVFGKFPSGKIAITFKFVNDIHILLADSGGVLSQCTNKIVLLLSLPNRIL